jgi:molecular chaperone GrpE (heat shock protein)
MDESPNRQQDDFRSHAGEQDHGHDVLIERESEQQVQNPDVRPHSQEPSSAVEPPTLSPMGQDGGATQSGDGQAAGIDTLAPRPEESDPDSGPVSAGHAQPENSTAEERLDTSLLVAELARMAAAVEGFNDRAAAQEDLISRLHDRVQVLQAGETKQLLKPIINGLVGLHSELAVQARSVNRELSVDEVVGMLDVLAVRVVNTLSGLGMEPFVPGLGEPFNGRFHQAIVTVPTGALGVDKQIAAVLRPGFTDPSEKRIAFPAQVSVYKFDPQLPDPAIDVANVSHIPKATAESRTAASSPEGSAR